MAPPLRLMKLIENAPPEVRAELRELSARDCRAAWNTIKALMDAPGGTDYPAIKLRAAELMLTYALQLHPEVAGAADSADRPRIPLGELETPQIQLLDQAKALIQKP